MTDDTTRGRRRAATRVTYQIDELFQGMMLNAGRSTAFRGTRNNGGYWRPAIDVYEADDVLNIIIELAGVREDQITVALDENVVRVRGERSPFSSDPNRSVHEIGIQYGPFAADIYLPYGVDHERVDATYENGMLQIRLQKTAPTQIAVTYVDPEQASE
jgi:HSP20 family protein